MQKALVESFYNKDSAICLLLFIILSKITLIYNLFFFFFFLLLALLIVNIGKVHVLVITIFFCDIFSLFIICDCFFVMFCEAL